MQREDAGNGQAQGFSPAHEPRSPEGIGAREVGERSELATWISGTHAFPADRDELVERARQEQAPDGVLSALRALPDRRFENLEEVAEQLGLGGGFHA
ncbi:hypothetical protein Ssi03_48710 [Sphaerisporangium siamense]|uniref:DUF2795 domain-containing protein n=1 Tax=Sphaerisporangium siamense TaxID=795645 RepID=A0A7W7D3U0_9ACTN|nr:DUF2795 domain-containing protein [Sphaerisporangium siamense]MBB4699469.1 hypothetical protein [Sphaerisporangium siamense]GII86881.1 hypothetical protein Ssi03_48710 [Sphaerisporangium siamense]